MDLNNNNDDMKIKLNVSFDLMFAILKLRWNIKNYLYVNIL